MASLTTLKEGFGARALFAMEEHPKKINVIHGHLRVSSSHCKCCNPHRPPPQILGRNNEAKLTPRSLPFTVYNHSSAFTARLKPSFPLHSSSCHQSLHNLDGHRVAEMSSGAQCDELQKVERFQKSNMKDIKRHVRLL